VFLTDVMEQRVNTKFCFELGKTQQKPMKCCKVSGDEVLHRSSVSEWFKRFKDGREDLQNDPRNGVLQPLEMQIQSQKSVKW
jgi:hypothetical protein